eukprot:16096-Heterococcus_DN1.PRE.2
MEASTYSGEAYACMTFVHCKSTMNAYTVARSAAAVGAAQRPHAMHEAQAVEDMCSVVALQHPAQPSAGRERAAEKQCCNAHWQLIAVGSETFMRCKAVTAAVLNESVCNSSSST